MKQAPGVARGGVSKSGVEFFGHRRAANHRTTLENRNRQARLGQIAGADEPVVAAADDDGVEASAGRGHSIHSIIPAGAPSPCRRTTAHPCHDQTQLTFARYSSPMPAATVENPQST